MSTETTKAPGSPSKALAALVDEARVVSKADFEATMSKMNWDEVDAGLFARIDREAAQTQSLTSFKGQPWPWLMLGGVAAAAAAAVVMMQPALQTSMPSASAVVESSAGDLAFQTGAGEVRIDGTKAQAGFHARQGDSIETRGAKAVFESQERVSWLLEDHSKVVVERANNSNSPIVLALSNGAVEADVTPVLSGEAFAVDVGGTRIAVHGTHLRVARNGDHVVVDLTEGVISIGAPPKVGSTYGTLVTAPAHVEFQAGAVGTSLVVEHEADAIRGAANITNPISEEAPTASVTPPAAAPIQSPIARVEEPAAPPNARTTTKARPAASPAAAPTPKDPDTIIQEAVKTCAAKYSSAPADTGTTSYFTSEATFDITPGGRLKNDAVFFNPPVKTEINECVRHSLSYRFEKGTSEHHHQVAIVLQQ
jgi:FecR protein